MQLVCSLLRGLLGRKWDWRNVLVERVRALREDRTPGQGEVLARPRKALTQNQEGQEE